MSSISPDVPGSKREVAPHKGGIYYILVQEKTFDEMDTLRLDPRGKGGMMVQLLKPREWEYAYECRFTLIIDYIVVARGRNLELEVFTLAGYQFVRSRLTGTSFTPSLYRPFDPHSLCPGKTRSQRTITQELMDTLWATVRVHYSDIHMDYAVLCTGTTDGTILVVHCGMASYNDDPRPLEMTINGVTYPVVGYILENEPHFEATEKDLSPHLKRTQDTLYVQIRYFGHAAAKEALRVEAAKRKHKLAKRKAQKSKRTNTMAAFNEGLAGKETDAVQIADWVDDVTIKTANKSKKKKKKSGKKSASDASDSSQKDGGNLDDSDHVETSSTLTEVSNKVDIEAAIADLRANLKKP